MASEHVHEWIPNRYDTGHQVCEVCGKDKMDWLEQQLAQMQKENVEMRRILEWLASGAIYTLEYAQDEAAVFLKEHPKEASNGE